MLSSARTGGLRAVKVNGETLSPLHVWRELIHLVGTRQVQQRIDDLFVDEWMKEAVKGGRDPKEFLPELDTPTRTFLMKCVERERDTRYQTPSEYRDALRRLPKQDW